MKKGAVNPESANPPGGAPHPPAWRKSALAAGLIAAVAIVWLAAPVPHDLRRLPEWVQGFGWYGPAVMVLIYVLGCLLFFPGWILTVTSGYLFGLGLGTLVVAVGATLGAAAAFTLGRTLGRTWVSRAIAGRPLFQAIDEAVAHGGFRLVLLLRLSPAIPFNLLNYALGLTRVAFPAYLLASGLGMLPGIVLYVYLGTAARSVADLGSPGTATGLRHWLFWLGMAATAVVAIWIARLAQQSLKDLKPRT